MQFSLIYRYDPEGPGPVESDVDAWMRLSEELGEAGALVHETGFFPASEGVTVTVGADGSATTSPGVPEATIAGYYTIRADDLDEAVRWATRVPVAGKGSVEVRQVVEFDGGDQA